MDSPATCPHCGRPIPSNAPMGVCPRCVVRMVMTGPQVQDQLSAEPDVPTALPQGFKDYEVLEEIGRGGMGVVYRARQKSLNREVSLKMILGGHFADAQALARFRAEAETTAHLQHPNIVAIHEVGEHEGLPYLVMDHVAGRSLAEVARERPLPARSAATYLKTIAEAIAYAHGRGVLHRDLKPSNVLINGLDQPRITDFGLAKRLSEGSGELTASGQTLGSPNFMAPEQATGERRRIGPGVDIYGLGATLYYLVTGRPPFVGETISATVRQVVEAEPVAPRLLNPQLPRDLELICLKCLEKDPGRRYETANALAKDIQRYLNHEPVEAAAPSAGYRLAKFARRNKLALAAGTTVVTALVIGLGVATWMFLRERQAYQRAEREKLTAHQNLYVADMNLAQQSIEENNFGRAESLLERHRPQKGEADLRGWEWRFLRQQCQGDELESFHQHDGPVQAVKFSPDGTWFASGGEDAKVIVRETSSKRILATLPSLPRDSYAGSVRSPLAISPDGTMMAVCGPGGVINLWTTTNWSRPMRTLPDSRVPMAFSGDSRLLAVGCSEATKIRVWNTKTGESEMRESGLSLPLDTSSGMSFLSGIPWLLVWSQDPAGKNVRLLEVGPVTNEAPRAAWELTIPDLAIPGQIRCVAVHPRDHQFVTGNREGMLDWWSLPNLNRSLPDLKYLGRIKAHQSDVWALAFSPDGQRLASGAGDFTVGLWDAVTRTNVVSYRGHRWAVFSVDFSPDGRRLLTGGADSTCKLWDAALDHTAGRFQIGWALRGGYRGSSCWIAEDGRELVSYSTNHLPELRTLDRGIVMGAPRRLLGNLAPFTSSSVDYRTALVQAETNRLEVWDITRERRIATLRDD